MQLLDRLNALVALKIEESKQYSVTRLRNEESIKDAVVAAELWEWFCEIESLFKNMFVLESLRLIHEAHAKHQMLVCYPGNSVTAGVALWIDDGLRMGTVAAGFHLRLCVVPSTRADIDEEVVRLCLPDMMATNGKSRGIIRELTLPSGNTTLDSEEFGSQWAKACVCGMCHPGTGLQCAKWRR